MERKIVWPKGTKLILVDTKLGGLSKLDAPIGSRAVVTGDYSGGDLVAISWIDRAVAFAQHDGDYIVERFVADQSAQDLTYYKALTEDVS